jgi:cobaltochelatase CobN
MNKRLKHVGVVVASLAGLVLAGAWLWHLGGPTRVLFVNFRDWQVADFHDGARSPLIRVGRANVEDMGAALLRSDVVVLFGMGLRMNEEQRAQVDRAIARGRHVFAYASTAMENDVNTLSPAQLEQARAYLGHGGSGNLEAFFAFCRRDVQGRRLFAPEPAAVSIRPAGGFIHHQTAELFSEHADFLSFYREAGLYKPDGEKVLIMTSMLSSSEPRSQQAPFALARALEARGMNVTLHTGFNRRLEVIRELRPDIVLFVAFGRLGMTAEDPSEAQRIMKELNVPVLSPLLVQQMIGEWEADPMGYEGGILSMSIALPEIDGVTTPFVIGGLDYDERGYQVFTPIPERVERFASMTERYLRLKQVPNEEKRLAIVYLKGPGQSGLAAQGLEVGPSLLNFLRALRAAGYRTGELPESAENLEAILQRDGPILGSYARGSIDVLLDNENLPRIPGDTLADWMQEALRPELVEDVRARYGASPGEYLVRRDAEGRGALSLPMVRFGNVVLLPQLMPALGDDAFALVHGAKQAPPYPYIATYLWARKAFDAHALIHFGTHGSLEFTPYKQTAMSSLDWADALVGDLPHFYYYTINNIGESVMAKRRSYADVVSYVTPPFRRGELHGELLALHRVFDQRVSAGDEALRQSLKEVILEKALSINLHLDLKLDDLAEKGLDEEALDRIHAHLHAIEAEKITDGLYTLGKPYAEEQVAATVVEMFADRLAQARATLDGVTEEAVGPHGYEADYRVPARADVAAIVLGGGAPLVSDAERSLWTADVAAHEGPQADVMAVMMSMAATPEASAETPEAVNLDEAALDLIGRLAADDAHRGQLESLGDPSRFSRMASLLDRSRLESVRGLAERIPAMGDAVRFMETEGVPELVRHMRNREVREQVLRLLQDDAMRTRAAAHRNAQMQGEAQALSREPALGQILSAVALDAQSRLDALPDDAVAPMRETLEAFLAAPPDVLRHAALHGELRRIAGEERFRDALGRAVRQLQAREQAQREARRKLADARNLILGLDRDIPLAADALRRSGEWELAGMLNALNGGFIPPSVGGDPLFSPGAIPTGRNMAGIDAETTPGEGAWRAGVRLADEMLDMQLKATGGYPRKVAFTLWGGEFIRDQGITVAQILHLLGVEPVRSSRGRVEDVRLVPAERLGRPRIDVVVQTSGQFRDVAASRLFLVDKAVQMAAQASAGEHANHVREGVVEAERLLLDRGYSPMEARELSTARVFGGLNGNYGTGITGLVESGDRYEGEDEIARRYLGNMGALYTRDRWGEFREGLFEAGLARTEVVMHTRSANTTGPLSLDHVYEFMGGLSAAITQVTGEDPQGFFVDLRNPTAHRVVDAKEAIWTEARSTILNPGYLAGLLGGGASSAEVLAETSRNLFGWSVTKASVIDGELWDAWHDTLIDDSHGLGTADFFERVNPHALQEITAVMLEAIRKDLWTPDPAVVQGLVDLHVDLVSRYEPACTGFVCNNAKLQAMVVERAQGDAKEIYGREIESVREPRRDGGGGRPEDAIALRRDDPVAFDLQGNGGIVLGVLGGIGGLLVASFAWRKRTRAKAGERRRPKKKPGHADGFTLIELLIVIGLLGALTALILPRFAADREEAMGDVCDYNQAGTVRVLKQYNQIAGCYPSDMHNGMDGTGAAAAGMPGLPSAQVGHMVAAIATTRHALTAGQAASLTNAGIAGICSGVGLARTAVAADVHVAAACSATGANPWNGESGGEIAFDGIKISDWATATGTPSWDSGAGPVVALWIAPTTDWARTGGSNKDWTRGNVQVGLDLAGQSPVPAEGLTPGSDPAFAYYIAYFKVYNDGTAARMIGSTCPEIGVLNP